MAKRIRVVVDKLVEGSTQLDAAASNYATRVHRLKVGDEFLAVDPTSGLEADARIVALGRHVAVDVASPRYGLRRGWPGLQLVQALGKGDKLERVLRDCVVFGAASLVVVQSERSVARGSDRIDTKRERWTSVAADAARQCLRSDIPQLHGPMSVVEALSHEAALRVVLHPDADALPLLTLLDRQRRATARLGLDVRQVLQLWVGPEGGFSDAELEALRSSGAQRCHLGELVLRTETAATAVLAVAGAALLDGSVRADQQRAGGEQVG